MMNCKIRWGPLGVFLLRVLRLIGNWFWDLPQEYFFLGFIIMMMASIRIVGGFGHNDIHLQGLNNKIFVD